MLTLVSGPLQAPLPGSRERQMEVWGAAGVHRRRAGGQSRAWACLRGTWKEDCWGLRTHGPGRLASTQSHHEVPGRQP